jgi:hypothetical protein
MKTILNTETCRIIQTGEGYRVLILARNGQWMENMPHSGDLRGLIGSLTLAIDVISGKVWLKGPVESKMENAIMELVHKPGGDS